MSAEELPGQQRHRCCIGCRCQGRHGGTPTASSSSSSLLASNTMRLDPVKVLASYLQKETASRLAVQTTFQELLKAADSVTCDSRDPLDAHIGLVRFIYTFFESLDNLDGLQALAINMQMSLNSVVGPE
jgi:hypothetical protein